MSSKITEKRNSDPNDEKEKSMKSKTPPAIDTSAVNIEGNHHGIGGDDDDDEDLGLSNMLMTCLLFIVHTVTNALLLSGWNPTRCLFWNLNVCPPDLDWITTWTSLGHFQVALLLSFLAWSVHGNPNWEVKLSHLVSALLCVQITVGILSKPYLHRPFLLIQLLVWSVLLVSLQWFTYTEYDEPLRLEQKAARYRGGATPTPRELFVAVSRFSQQNNSTRSLMSGVSTPGHRSGFATPTSGYDKRTPRIFGCTLLSITLGAISIGQLVQVMELVLLPEKNTYYVGASSSLSSASRSFQSSADLMLVDKLLVLIILGASLRYFDVLSQRIVLMGHTIGLMLYLIVLTSDPGDLMEVAARRGGGFVAFCMILTAVIGVL